eukprot:4018013-Alexandrium_andersonii.AAC.1
MLQGICIRGEALRTLEGDRLLGEFLVFQGEGDKQLSGQRFAKAIGLARRVGAAPVGMDGKALLLSTLCGAAVAPGCALLEPSPKDMSALSRVCLDALWHSGSAWKSPPVVWSLLVKGHRIHA